MPAAVLSVDAVLEVPEDVIGVCEIFPSCEDDFLSDIAETGQHANRPITGWFRWKFWFGFEMQTTVASVH